MTVYVCETRCGTRRHLWADDPNEALLAAYEAGATLEDDPGHSWGHFELTPTQFFLAQALGAQTTDWLGPARHARAAKGLDFSKLYVHR